MSSGRAEVLIEDDVVVKRFLEPWCYDIEKEFYGMVPWACPGVVSFDDDETTLVLRRYKHVNVPVSGGAVTQLTRLLRQLAGMGVHHRDLHPGNIVATPDGVRLIDWETAIVAPGVSYDVFGPVDVPVPAQHGGLLPQWWGSNDPVSVKNVWGVVPPVWEFR